MKRIDFNRDWTCRCLTREGEAMPVTLPHDAMISEPRTEDSVAEGNIGWYIGGNYEYVKRFDAPEAWQGKALLIEFESVSQGAAVFVNGQKAAYRPYGYSYFYVDPAPYLKYGEANELRVVAHNASQPASRWYPGTGIYRPVALYVAEEAHIPVNGLRVRTLGIHPARIEVRVKTSAPGTVSTAIHLDGKTVQTAQAEAVHTGGYAPVPATFGSSAQTVSPAQRCEYEAVLELAIPDARLWNTEHPVLYTCTAHFANDEVTETFGIRELKWNAREGMTINGDRVILRGACIHHDNGVLGACTYPEAEARRVRLLKENGYNALRSAHNPCSKALLDACDRLGIRHILQQLCCLNECRIGP